VNEVASLVEILMVATIVGAPVVLVRWLAGEPRWGLADLVRVPSQSTWPRGVQEEEPIRWRVELIDRSADSEPVSCEPACEPAPRSPTTSRRLRPITTA
jgi:hypothetical protein